MNPNGDGRKWDNDEVTDELERLDRYYEENAEIARNTKSSATAYFAKSDARAAKEARDILSKSTCTYAN